MGLKNVDAPFLKAEFFKEDKTWEEYHLQLRRRCGDTKVKERLNRFIWPTLRKQIEEKVGEGDNYYIWLSYAIPAGQWHAQVHEPRSRDSKFDTDIDVFYAYVLGEATVQDIAHAHNINIASVRKKLKKQKVDLERYLVARLFETKVDKK